MRNSILVLLFTLFSFISTSQTSFDFGPTNYNSFLLSNQALCGVGNVYCAVYKQPNPNQFGYYVYQVYFASNSYFADCSASRTFIPNIEVMYLERGNWYYPQNFYIFWLNVGQTTLGYTLYHPNPNLQIKIRTGFLQPTIY